MKAHDTRWKNVWGEVREFEQNGELYFDFVLWADHHYVRRRESAVALDRNPDLYGIILELLSERVSTSMREGGWFG